MDLRLYGRVVWRFRIVVAIGVLLAIGLALLSFVKVSFAGGFKVSYRQSEDWSASTTYVLSGSGFPVGSVQQAASPKSPLSLSSLAALYAQYATGDDVMRRLRRTGPVNGVVSASSFVDSQTSQRYPLPIFAITADAATPENALSLARRASSAFMSFVKDQQNRADIPDIQRVQFRVISAAKEPALVSPRKKTLPIVIFLTILTAALGLAFILENLRPRVHPISTLDEDESRPTRRTA